MRTTFLCGALFTAAAPLAAQSATFTILGPGSASDMNPTGTAVVGTDNQGAFLWTASGGYLPLGQINGSSVSADGTVVLGDMLDPVTNLDSAGRWTAATGWVSLGALAGSSGQSQSSAYGMSANGNVATGLGWLSAARGAAFEWVAGIGMQQLPQLGPNSSRGNCVSGDARFIGGWDEDMTGPRCAALWDRSTGNETLILQSPSNIEGIGEIYRLSTNGAWAVGDTTNFEAYRWSAATGVTPIFHGVPDFFNRSFAFGVSDDGAVVVGAAGQPPFNLQATIWTAAAGTQLLRDVLLARGATAVSSWIPSSAFDISPDGSVILGTALPQVGFATQWFIATIDWSLGSAYCTPAVPNSTGASSELTAEGSLAIAANDLTVGARHLPLNSFGYFLTSRTQGNVGQPGGSTGVLCLGGAIGRYVGPGQIKNSGATGAISLQLDLMRMPTPTGLVQAAAGETWNFQAWHRDAVAGAATSNFTNGRALTFQ